MKIPEIFAQIRAAQRLSAAFEGRRAPEQADLDTLGMPSRIKSIFER
tara:strand:- start:355 stop:495 length:141 start_codon:yes stop_codon:yes gene_type:complete